MLASRSRDSLNAIVAVAFTNLTLTIHSRMKQMDKEMVLVELQALPARTKYFTQK